MRILPLLPHKNVHENERHTHTWKYRNIIPRKENSFIISEKEVYLLEYGELPLPEVQRLLENNIISFKYVSYRVR